MKSPCSVLYFFLFTDSSTRQTATPTPRAPDATTNDGATLDLITLTRQRGGRRRCSLGHQSSCFRCWPVVPPDYYCVSVSLACSPRCHRAPSSSQVRYYLATQAVTMELPCRSSPPGLATVCYAEPSNSAGHMPTPPIHHVGCVHAAPCWSHPNPAQLSMQIADLGERERGFGIFDFLT